MSEIDYFRPRHEPAVTIYDALLTEAKKRRTATGMEWIENERKAVWSAARDYAQMHGKHVPTIAEVERAETSAAGHTDYALKFALGVAECIMHSQQPTK